MFGERKIYHAPEAVMKARLKWLARGSKPCQKSLFRNWNGKYDLAVAQVEQTANKLDNATSHLQQRQNQLGQWNKLERAYSLWNKSPQTVEMRNLAKGLQSPQLQERLNSISKVEQQEKARTQASSGRQAGLSA